MLLSLIVPVYNAEKLLPACLDSIFKQTLQDIEIIIINDGSTDNSQRVIDHYAQHHAAIVNVYNKENKGAGYSRNEGVKLAKGNYIAFVDCDDTIEPNYITNIKKIINDWEPDMIIIGYNRIYHKQQNILERNYTFSSLAAYNKPISIDTNPELISKTEGAAWLKIVKREILLKDENLLFSNSRIAEDLEASLKWYLNVPQIYSCNEKLYNYLIHEGSLNFVATHIEDFIGVLESVCNYYKQQVKFEKYKAELEFQFTKHLLVSNMLRLRAAKLNGNYTLFMKLRYSLMNYFPEYHKNMYLKNEPFYVRLAIQCSYYFPQLFKWIL